MDRNFFRRKNFIVKPGYQIPGAILVFLLVILYAFFFGLMMIYPLSQELVLAQNDDERARIAEIVLYLHKSIWPSTIVIAMLASVHVIFSTHRTAGPIYRFEKTTENLLNGKFGEQIILRKHDKLVELKDNINNLSTYLEEAKTTDKEFRQSLKLTLETLLQSTDTSNTKTRNEIETLLKEINDYPGFFTKKTS